MHRGVFLQTLLHPQVRAEGIYTEPLVLDSTITSGAYFLVMIRDGVRRSLVGGETVLAPYAKLISDVNCLLTLSGVVL